MLSKKKTCITVTDFCAKFGSIQDEWVPQFELWMQSAGLRLSEPVNSIISFGSHGQRESSMPTGVL